ncbi:hypothetical protein GCM10009799_33930 [Nocardiopsis rhodophaea]|uniref:Uncharacterized protein n=1 Tax=Nocardiopsis rhodophaea TaxID=280238 RepID=A0ABP5EU83_9ACTN
MKITRGQSTIDELIEIWSLRLADDEDESSGGGCAGITTLLQRGVTVAVTVFQSGADK